ncbi:MAG: DNA (cytosine-5-)-methyltransferase [Ktedonobacteraceae bacterium]
MADIDITPAKRDISAIMRKVHSTNTVPEAVFRAALDARNIHYLTSTSDMIGKPDVIMPVQHIAIFIDGDYWHGNQWRMRGLTSLEDQFQHSSSGSRDYWLKKIPRNMERDCSVTMELLSQGWTVLRFWESDIRKNIERCVEITCDALAETTKRSSYSLLPRRTFAEFFAGIGLMRMGLERQGWTVAFANDIDKQKYEMYEGQFLDASLHWTDDDVHQLSSARVPTISLATASFPCTDLSLAGARKGLEGRQSSAFWGFARVLDGMGDRRPPLILLENVTGFLTSNGGKDIRRALLELNRLGYKIDMLILDAVRFVPQSRQRLFIVGIQEDDSEVAKLLSDATSSFFRLEESNVRPKAIVDFIKCHEEIQWKLRSLPFLPERSIQLEEIFEDLPVDAPEWWSSARTEYLLNQMSLRHRTIAERMIAGSTWSYGTVFRRMRNGHSMAELRTDGIAGCLRTPKGGSAKQILFKAGRGQYFARLITPREAARLMGADGYNIVVSGDQALFGFGDAVCVPVIEWIAKYYFNSLVSELIRGRPLSLRMD